MSGTDDPPLFAALAAIHGLLPRHQLREDRMTYDPDPDQSVPSGRVYDRDLAYGADDDPSGPEAPPLEHPAGRRWPDDNPWPDGYPDEPEFDDPDTRPSTLRDLVDETRRGLERGDYEMLSSYGADDDPNGPPEPALGTEHRTRSLADTIDVHVTRCDRCNAPIVHAGRRG